MQQAAALSPCDPVFGAAFYAPYEAAAAAALTLLCQARRAYEDDVLALRFRLKTPASIRGKLQKKGLPQNAWAASVALSDVAGLRTVLRSKKAVYRFADALTKCGAFQVAIVHDYIAHPKKSGYRSLHLILRVPVYADRQLTMIPVEIQLRTKEMDEWANIEHRLIYKPVQKALQ